MPEWNSRPGHAFLKPLLIPSRTTHTRVWPTAHSFSYSYFLVGIPVGWKGRAGCLLGAEQHGTAGFSFPQSTWFSVEAEDYLERGSHPDGLRGKLNDYLSSQGIDATQFEQVYLVTAPRFLGFSFNPVSFWYLYGRDKTLAAMIYEVNNTFDERRMYFLQAKEKAADGVTSNTKFTQECVKDFHVSPFMDRQGTYLTTTNDPFPCTGQPNGRIDNRIVLRSPSGQVKIVARIFSTTSPIDPSELSPIQVLSVLVKWSWVGLLTELRILREARILRMVKKLPVFYRPEVMKTSMGRTETTEEIQIEPAFRALLQNMSEATATRLRYTSAAGPDRRKPIDVGPSNDNEPTLSNAKPHRALELHILTPEFYSQLVRSHSIHDLFFGSCLDAAAAATTLYTPDPDHLKTIIQRLPPPTLPPFPLPPALLLINLLRSNHSIFHVIWLLTLHTFSASAPTPKPSDLDLLYLTTRPAPQWTKHYASASLKTLLAHRLAWGSVRLLKLYGVVICWGIIGMGLWTTGWKMNHSGI